MPRKKPRRGSDSSENEVSRYAWFVMFVFLIGLSILTFVMVDGIVRAMTLPGYMATMFRGATVLAFLVMGLVLVPAILSKNR